MFLFCSLSHLLLEESLNEHTYSKEGNSLSMQSQCNIIMKPDHDVRESGNFEFIFARFLHTFYL